MSNLQGFLAQRSLLRRVMVALAGLSRRQKRAILIVNDLILLNFALWLSMSLRLGELYMAPTWPLFFLLGIVPLISVGMFFQMGPYRHVTRFFGARGTWLIVISVVASSLFLALAAFLTAWPGIPRSVVLLYPVFGTGLVWGSRQIAAWLLKAAGVASERGGSAEPNKVLIYGAGAAGTQLRDALRSSPGYEAVGFVDGNRTVQGRYVNGLKVHAPARLAELIAYHGIEEVLLALPASQREDRRAALRMLEALPVKVRIHPAVEDLAAGRVTINDLRPVEAEDLLGRDPIPPDPNLMSSNIRGKSVMVTGAGGSIGSELVRQILRLGPRRLVLFEPPRRAHEIQRGDRRPDARRHWHNGSGPQTPACSARFSTARWWPTRWRRTRSRRSTTPPPTSTFRSSRAMRWQACATTRSARRSLADVAGAHGVELSC